MMPSTVHFIINPAAGKDEPILSYIQKVFEGKPIQWDCTVTREENEAFEVAQRLAGSVDLVIVYGGDGTVSEVARALQGSMTPLGIAPGGTANVLSKELHIPQDSEKALQLIADGHYRFLKMDMGQANGSPFLLRINVGIMADMVLDADKKLKANLGQVAYALAALKKLAGAKPINYRLLIDGVEIKEPGVSLTVTNAGSIGIGNLRFLPDIDVCDGYLDVILLRDADFFSVLKVAGSTLFQTGSDVLRHWRCKAIKIETDQAVRYICDDSEKSAAIIDIRLIPGNLTVLVPVENK